MDNLDRKIRRFLVDEGYLLPSTDTEIERSLIEYEAQCVYIPAHLDNPNIYMGIKKAADRETPIQSG